MEQGNTELSGKRVFSSITVIHSMMANLSLLVTVHGTQQSQTPVMALRQSLQEHIQALTSSLVSFLVQDIRRFGEYC